MCRHYVAEATERIGKMKKWEYHTIIGSRHEAVELDRILNTFGRQGWRVISVQNGDVMMEREILQTEAPIGGQSPTGVALDEEAGGR